MRITFHAGQRMNQRGIKKEALTFVLEHGEPQGYETVLTQEAAMRLIVELQRQMRVAKKVMDKGGVTVVSDMSRTLDETIITTYNCLPGKKGRRWQGKQRPLRARNYAERTFKKYSSRRRDHE